MVLVANQDCRMGEVTHICMIVICVMILLAIMVLLPWQTKTRLGWLDHQHPRVIDGPVPELVVQLLET